MQTYLLPRTRRSERNISPRVACVCGAQIPVAEAYRVRVPVGWGGMKFDPRQKTPTGGRFGLPGKDAVRRFVRTEVRFAGLCCAMKFPIIERPRDAWFKERCRKK